MVECVYDIDCIGQSDVTGAIFGCPQCVAGLCMERKLPNGNVNCCKRTPGNDLVITNGCGANNICFGFRNYDQCEVNQHAAYCHPGCYYGNIGPNLNLAPDFSRCTNKEGVATTIGNNQGSKPITMIYPMSYCMTRDIKWKNDITGKWEENPAYDGLSTPVLAAEAGLVCAAPPLDPIPCDDWTDCLNFYSDTMFCPACVKKSQDTVGYCEAQLPNGNKNCCKRTPGNELVITNGCGANNICFGFNQNDQCEVNQHAAYCHPMCPDGNLDANMNIDTSKCNLWNDQGSKWDTPIYPIQWCLDRNIIWKEGEESFSSWYGGSAYTDSPTQAPTRSPTQSPTVACKLTNVACSGHAECCTNKCTAGKCKA
jgi:hypothetical protein